MIAWRQAASHCLSECSSDSQSTSIIRTIRPALPVRSDEFHTPATMLSPIVASTFPLEMPVMTPGPFGTHIVSLLGDVVIWLRADGLNDATGSKPVLGSARKSPATPTLIALTPVTRRTKVWTVSLPG